MATRNVERNRTCVCSQCGETFLAVHWNADLCSARCRKRRQRELERIDQAWRKCCMLLDQLKAHKGHVGEEKARLAVKRIASRAVGLRDYWD